MEVPGSAGYGIFGDESLELWRDPLGYFNKRIEEHGPVFRGRVLNKPTIFVTSSSTVKEMLCDNHNNFADGYKEYMFELFEKNVMFLEDDMWKDVRELLQQSFSHDSLQQTIDIARQLINSHIEQTPLDQSITVYQHLKALATQLSVSLFLSHTLNGAESREVSDLMTTHWHGIISLPVNMRLPLLPWKSGYGKALVAKDKLIEIISQKLDNNEASPIASAVRDSSPSRDLATRNILLFISALFPKAMASLMTSLLFQLSLPENSQLLVQCLNDEQMLECVILECQRLWPPFLGGRRICSKSCQVGGYVIPEGHSVVYLTYTANRDKNVFNEPDEFRPQRWIDSTLSRDLIWTFGGGPRTCAGRHLSTIILKEWLQLTLASLSWELSPGTRAPQYKVLPVIRPSNEVKMAFQKRIHDSNDTRTDSNS